VNNEAPNTHPHPTTRSSALGPEAAYFDFSNSLLPEIVPENIRILPSSSSPSVLFTFFLIHNSNSAPSIVTYADKKVVCK
jgi:hypothetical protein